VAPLRPAELGPAEAHEECRPEEEDDRHRVEEALGAPGYGLIPEIGAESELLEGNRRDVEPGRATDLVLAVIVMHITVRVVVDPIVGDGDEVPSRSELQSIDRAGAYAGGNLPSASRSKQRMHFWTCGIGLSYSNFGMLNGHATMQ
jgi:hypothetical protein